MNPSPGDEPSHHGQSQCGGRCSRNQRPRASSPRPGEVASVDSLAPRLRPRWEPRPSVSGVARVPPRPASRSGSPWLTVLPPVALRGPRWR